MYILGLTGGLEQGKSTVGELLRSSSGLSKIEDLEYSDFMMEVANVWLGLIDQSRQETNHWLEHLSTATKSVIGRSPDVSLISTEDGDLHTAVIKYVDGLRAGAIAPPIERANKVSHRLVYQWITACLRQGIGPAVWSDAMDDRLRQLAGSDLKLVTVGGIRQAVEAEPIHSRGGHIIRVSKPGTRTDNHVTELTISEVPYDVEIINDGDLPALGRAVQRFWSDYGAGKLVDIYRASD